MMDLFYENVKIYHKQRIHFNEFMLNVHKEMHKLQDKKINNPLAVIGGSYASRTRLLCLDEF